MSEENTSSAPENKVSLNSVILKKIGMTRIFDNDGNHLPVTVLSLEDSNVVQVKTKETDGYNSIKFAYGEKREKLISSPKKGELKKAGVEVGYSKMAETRLADEEVADFADSLGAKLSFESFGEGDLVSISGLTKGKGFSGVVKKFGFAGGPMSHGSKFHRTTGSIGNRATPGKVWKGKKMPGHLGDKKQTVKNLKVVKINVDKKYILVKGSVPGAKNSFVRVTKS